MFFEKILDNKVFSKLPENKVYIIPNKLGLSFFGASGLIVLMGLVYSNNSILLLGFIVFIFLIAHAFMTNNNLEGISIKEVAFNESNINGDVEIVIENTSDEKYSLNFDLENIDRIAQNKKAENYITLLEEKKACRVTLKKNLLKRGVYQVKRLRCFSTYPFGLFYAWKFFYTKDLQVYSYPQILEREGAEFSYKFSEQLKGLSLASSDMKYKEHRPYQDTDLARNIDWKKFAKSHDLQVKVYESDESKEVSFFVKPTISEESICLLASSILAAHKAGYQWSYESERSNFRKMKSLRDVVKCFQDLAYI